MSESESESERGSEREWCACTHARRWGQREKETKRAREREKFESSVTHVTVLVSGGKRLES
jgi:hypothetical protein